jgi:hypothetical protein
MNPGRQMNLGVYAVGTGNHVSGWRVPGAATSSEDFAIFKTIADSCERGKLDFLFVGDSLAFVGDRHPGQMLRFEPLTLHAALARRHRGWDSSQPPQLRIRRRSTSPGCLRHSIS